MSGTSESMMTGDRNAEQLRAVLGEGWLAALDRAGAPILLAGGDPLRLAHANAAALALFGAVDVAALEARLLAPASTSAELLAAATRALAPGTKRIERLALDPALGKMVLLCSRAASAPSLFVFAGLAPRSRLLRRASPPAAPAPAAVHVEASVALDALRRDLGRRYPGLKPARFLWRTDGESRVAEITPPLAEIVGSSAVSLIGRDLASAARAFGIDPGGRLGEALRGRATFSGVELDWPIEGTAVVAPVSLGALPAFDRDIGFDGWRGFGVIHLDRLREGPAPQLPPALDPAQAEGDASGVVVPLRPLVVKLAAPEQSEDQRQLISLSPHERNAFREIALTLGARPESGPAHDEEDAEVLSQAEPEKPHEAEPEKHREAEPGDRHKAEPVSALEVAPASAEAPRFARSASDEQAGRIAALELAVRQRAAEAADAMALVEASADGLLLFNADGALLGANAAAEKLLGRGRDEIAGRNLAGLFAAESQPAAIEALTRLKRGEAAAGGDFTALGRGGDPLALRIGFVRLDPNGPGKFAAVLRDFSGARRDALALNLARGQAEAENRAKTEYLATVAHEIRTPLNAILGFAEIIMDERFGPVGNARYREYLRDIHASGSHVMSLVNDLLDLSKIEAGKLELNFAAVDLNRLVAECVALIQPQANREKVITRLALAPRLPAALADERASRQIVLNLLANAVRYNEPGGQVIISTAQADKGHVLLRVKDTGIGMSESELKLALEPFRQASGRREGGSGLGLPLTKALAEANRAAFSIRSRKNEGTLVEIAFPTAPGAADAASAAE